MMKIKSRSVVWWSSLVILTLAVGGWFYYEARIAPQKSIEPIHLGMSYEEVESLVFIKDKTPQTHLSSRGSSLRLRFEDNKYGQPRVSVISEVCDYDFEEIQSLMGVPCWGNGKWIELVVFRGDDFDYICSDTSPDLSMYVVRERGVSYVLKHDEIILLNVISTDPSSPNGITDGFTDGC
jgi:hypothetical protein